MARFEYKTIDTSTINGIAEAEKLKALGWRIISVGLYTIQFERCKK